MLCIEIRICIICQIRYPDIISEILFRSYDRVYKSTSFTYLSSDVFTYVGYNIPLSSDSRKGFLKRNVSHIYLAEEMEYHSLVPSTPTTDLMHIMSGNAIATFQWRRGHGDIPKRRRHLFAIVIGFTFEREEEEEDDDVIGWQLRKLQEYRKLLKDVSSPIRTRNIGASSL